MSGMKFKDEASNVEETFEDVTPPKGKRSESTPVRDFMNDILTRSAFISDVDRESQDYMKRLIELITGSSNRAIEVINIEQNSIVVFHNGKSAVGLMLAQPFINNPNLNKEDVVRESRGYRANSEPIYIPYKDAVVNLLHEKIERSQITLNGKGLEEALVFMNYIVVVPEDYPRLNIMAKSILNILTGAVDVGINDFIAEFDFEEHHDLSYVREGFEQNSPHEVAPYYMFGTTLSGRPIEGEHSSRNVNFCTILAYVDFSYSEQYRGNPIYIPTFHISEVILPTGSMALFSIAFASFIEHWVENDYRFMTPFSRTDGEHGFITNLVLDPEKKTSDVPWTTHDTNEIEQFIDSDVIDYRNGNSLVIDIQDGRVHPAIFELDEEEFVNLVESAFTCTEAEKNRKKNNGRFVDGIDMRNVTKAFEQITTEFSGDVIHDHGRRVSTSFFTFLNAAKFRKDFNLSAPLANITLKKAFTRINVIKDHVEKESVRTLYVKRVLAVNGEFRRSILNALSALNRGRSSYSANAETVLASSRTVYKDEGNRRRHMYSNGRQSNYNFRSR